MPVCKKCGKDMFLKGGEWVCECEEKEQFDEELEEMVDESGEELDDTEQSDEAPDPKDLESDPEEEYKRDVPGEDESGDSRYDAPVPKDYNAKEDNYRP
jgi:uncharacterized Zn finger protein (UPF0148 family)